MRISRLEVGVGRSCARRLALAGWVAAGPLLAQEVTVPVALSVDPPAYGYQLGDVVLRQVELSLPAGARLDLASLPPPSRLGSAVELREVEHVGEPADQRQTLRLRYQVFRSPPQPSVLELPVLNLRVLVPHKAGGTREVSLRVESHPLMVSPIAPLDPPNREGLGTMQSDLPPPWPEDSTRGFRVALWSALVLAGLGALVWHLALRPWWSRRGRPFARAWRQVHQRVGRGTAVQADRLEDGLKALHDAIRQDAGRVILAGDVDRWLADRPQYRPLESALMAFQARSAQRLYAPPVAQEDADALRDEAKALLALARALSRAEALG